MIKIDSMNKKLIELHYYQEHFSGKWKPQLILLISQGCNRFNAIQKQLPGITKQMLSQQLKELDHNKIIKREAFAEIPPRVEYTLTPFGKSIFPVLQAMCKWSEEQLETPTALTLF